MREKIRIASEADIDRDEILSGKTRLIRHELSRSPPLLNGWHLQHFRSEGKDDI